MIRTIKNWFTQDRVITIIVIVVSVVAWYWNIRITFLGGEGRLVSSYTHHLATKWPIITLPVFFCLGAWGGFRRWLVNHPVGLAYLAIILGHVFWPLPR
jgi:hypothetical protein